MFACPGSTDIFPSQTYCVHSKLRRKMNSSLQPVATDPKNILCALRERTESGSTPALLDYLIALAFGISIVPLAASTPGEDNETSLSHRWFPGVTLSLLLCWEGASVLPKFLP